MSSPWALGTDVSQRSALHVATCPVACMQVLFASNRSVQALPVASWAGLRASQLRTVGTLSPQASRTAKAMRPLVSQLQRRMAVATPSLPAFQVGTLAWLVEPAVWQAWQAVTVGNISAAQLRTVAASAFATDTFAAHLAPSVLSAGMTDAQLVAVSDTAFARLSSAAFVQLSPAQAAYLSAKYNATAAQLALACADVVFSSSSSSSGSLASSSSSSSTGGSLKPPIPAPAESEPSRHLRGGAIAGIVLGVLGVLLLGALAWRHWQSRARASHAAAQGHEQDSANYRLYSSVQ